MYLLQDSYDGSIAEHRMHTEFITDMGERLENQPFLSKYSFRISETEITYDTGLKYIESLKKSLEAAKKDTTSGMFDIYHERRQEAFLRQGQEVLGWANDSSNQAYVLAFSLCPSSEELSFSEAKRQSFKPDRMMASIQLHAKNNTGETIAFSLDGLTLDRLQLLFVKLGLDEKVCQTTLEQLATPIYIDNSLSAEATVDAIVSAYDAVRQEQDGGIYRQGINIEKNIVEANEFVAAHPEAYELYKSIISEVATSLNRRITPGLARTVQQKLRASYHDNQIPKFLLLQEGDFLDSQLASDLIEYLRRVAIPEYLTQKLAYKQSKHHQAAHSADSYDIGSAGAQASIAGRQYDGACPSSATGVATVASAMQQQASQFGIYKTTAAYELPQPVFTKGEYDVIPIGSCPMCKAECGTGIRNRRSGDWFCTQSNCSAYKEDIYNYVFGNYDLDNEVSGTAKNPVRTMPKKSEKNEKVRQENKLEIRACQDKIWLLENELYNNTELSSEERAAIVKEIVDSYQVHQILLRGALGQAATLF